MCDVNYSACKKLFLNDEVYLIEERRSIINSRSGNEAVFSISEVSIIKELVIAGGKPVSRRYLLDNCWGGRVVTNTSLSVAINKIRERLTSVGLEDTILTVPRLGYQINLTDDEKMEVVPLFNQIQEADKDKQVNQNQEVDKDKQGNQNQEVDKDKQGNQNQEVDKDKQGNQNQEVDKDKQNYNDFRLNFYGVNLNRDYLIVIISWTISLIILTLFLL